MKPLEPLTVKSNQRKLLVTNLEHIINLVNRSEVNQGLKTELLDSLLNLGHSWSTDLITRQNYEDRWLELVDTYPEYRVKINEKAHLWTSMGYLCFNFINFTALNPIHKTILINLGFGWNKFSNPKRWELKLRSTTPLEAIHKDLSRYL